MAVRIAGVTLPNDKRVDVALTYIYGMGHSLSNAVIKSAQVDGGTRVRDLNEEQANRLRQIVEKEYKVEGDLRREVTGNIKRLKETGAYRGTRHSKGLPCHGQRTKTNSRTVRGNLKKTLGSGRKPAQKK